jgi:dienelactone hydrolase
MRAQSLFASDPSEDLALFSRPVPTPDSLSDAHCQGLEFSSRGDRVAGRLLRPGASEGPLPLILLQHSAGTWRQPSPLDASTARWLEAGAAVVSIELPLHGERASAKLSERLLGALGSDAAALPAHAELDPVARLLRIEFTRQAIADLRRCLDAVSRIAAIDPRRIAFVGFGVGATVGTLFAAVDPRPAAVALAPPADRTAPAEVDPRRYVSEIAPRPLLLLDAGGSDETGAKRLFEAAAEPKSIDSCDPLPSDPSAPPCEALLRFVASHLDLTHSPVTG